ncbi:alpha-L-rhamnosidase [Kribbella antibiotica]|uniref:alpha-L-rhamnosidase n=1 Tax=Kribbella antibiotica TaxID=190195 RepID=A0A4R4ZLC5_9ACTN|nr:family 78 glycoside hydrolase catalytic domain [Kribbella antibiotica]TDD59611.1 alpha-L-rhamnosidase [Kribbella antibiotica]
MRIARKLLIASLAAMMIVGSSTAGASPPGTVRATELRVDNTVNPLGIDNATPAFSWQLTGSGRQTAYRVVVGTARGRADVWDSGRIASDESIGIQYGGPALQSSTRYYWTVQVWDAHGQQRTADQTAWWETGLLNNAAWQGAQWITPDTGNAKVWSDFSLDLDFTIKSVAAGIIFRATDAANHYLWQINTATSPGKVMLRPHVRVNGSYRTLAEIDLAPVVTPANASAQHHLTTRAVGSVVTTAIDGIQVDERQQTEHTRGTIGFRTSSTGGVAERAAFDNLVIRDPDGQLLLSDDFATAPDAHFPASSVVDGQLEPSGDPVLMAREPEAPMLRKEFAVGKRISRARATVYGLGFYELRLNGSKVGDRVLTPASTPYERHNLYDTYDITDAVRRGANTVGIWLGNGYGARYNPYGFRWTGPKQAIALITVTYTDGTSQTVRTDNTWTWASGPIVANDIYAGETYDARAELPGWDQPGYDTAAWQPVRTTAAPSPVLASNTMPAIKVAQTLRPVKLTEPKPGVFIYDLGQNIAGWTRLRVSGLAGTAVRLRTAEELGADGLLDTRTNRSAAATDTYILKGSGVETYEPRFTYHGFRYVEVTGLRPDSLEGRAIHADLASTGSFQSSDELLNTIWRNNRWSILNNSMSLPTDTPVRDERTPPTMDVQAYRDAAIREFGMNRFYAKYLRDLPPGTALPSDAVKSQYPDMAGGQVSLAWRLYEQYGDRGTLAASYPLMKEFIDKNATDQPSLVWPGDQGFGDWCPPDHGPEANGGMGSPNAGDCFSEVSLVNTALWYQQTVDLAESAQALNKADDSTKYEQLAAAIKVAFNKQFLNADNTYSSGRQTTSVLPLALGLVPADRIAQVGAKLAETITTKNAGHLDTGIFGTRYLVDALAAINRLDLAMQILGQRSYPSFGFQIDHGATTSWEQWLYDAGMITHDHAMFAGINTSLYTVLAGIQLTSPAYKTVTIAPQIPPGLTYVTASIDTVRGRISSSWRKTSKLTLTISTPLNSTPTVVVPLPSPTAPVTAPAKAVLVSRTTTTATYRAAPGSSTFVIG